MKKLTVMVAFLLISPAVYGSCRNSGADVIVDYDEEGLPSNSNIVFTDSNTILNMEFDENGSTKRKKTRFRKKVRVCLGNNSLQGQRYKYTIPKISFFGVAILNKLGPFSIKYGYGIRGGTNSFSGTFSQDFPKTTYRKNFDGSDRISLGWSKCSERHEFELSLNGNMDGKNTSQKAGNARIQLIQVDLGTSVTTKLRIKKC